MKRITINPVRDIETWALLGHDGQFDYAGPIEECKGDASKAEQQAADSMRQKELDLMQQQLGLQQQQISGVNSVLDPMIANGGMSPEQEAAMRSIFMNTTAQDFRDTSGMVNQSLVARGLTGGSNAGGGAVAQQFGQLGAMENQLKASGLNNIQVQKAQQLREELGIKMGVAGLYGQNTGMFNSGAGGALNSGVTAAHNVDTAGTSFWGPLIGGALGLGAKFATGGAGGMGMGGNPNSPSGIGVGGDSTGWYD